MKSMFTLFFQKYIGHCSIIVEEYLDPLPFLDELLIARARYPAYNEMEGPIFCFNFSELYPSMINFTGNDSYIPRELFIPYHLRQTRRNSHYKTKDRILYDQSKHQIFHNQIKPNQNIVAVSYHRQIKQICRIFQPRKR